MGYKPRWVCDVCGADLDGENKVRFSVGSDRYMLDLCQQDAKGLELALEPYVAKAEPDDSEQTPSKGRKARGTAQPKEKSASFHARQWAESTNATTNDGATVTSRGRVHPDILAKWEAAGSPKF